MFCKMNCKSVLITGAVLAVIYVLLNALIHGVLLNDIYMQNASVWRPESEMKSLFCFLLFGEGIFAFFYAMIFAAGYDASLPGLGQGLRFGLLMALLVAPFSALSWYTILPIPAALAVYWFIADFVAMLILGAAAGLLYKSK